MKIISKIFSPKDKNIYISEDNLISMIEFFKVRRVYLFCFECLSLLHVCIKARESDFFEFSHVYLIRSQAIVIKSLLESLGFKVNISGGGLSSDVKIKVDLKNVVVK